MNRELLEATVRHLYEGTAIEPRLELEPNVEFHDPVVIVRSRPGVVAMFARLNRMFPATEVAKFEPDGDSARHFRLTVHYRRTPRAAARVFESAIEFDFVHDRISRMTEHWKKPVALSGDSSNPVLGMMRSALGRLVS